ncbi:MAG: hypothetical protein ACI9MR_000940 [Myxococcota bacterium]
MLSIALLAGCIAEDRQMADDPDTSNAEDTVVDTVDTCDLDCTNVVAGPCETVELDSARCECVAVLKPLYTSCDDENACTWSDRCGVDGCEGLVRDAEVDCDDGNPCTLDTCDVALGCVNSPAEQGACDDGNPCTEGEVCGAGVCQTWTSYVCGPCQEDDDTCEADYGDGDRCDGVLVCRGGICLTDEDTRVSCESSELGSCSVSACDPLDGRCHEVDRVDGTQCSDGVPCTVGDACEAGACVGTELLDPSCGCTDGNDCFFLEDADACNGTFSCIDDLCTETALSRVRCDTADPDGCMAIDCDPADGLCKSNPVPPGPCDDDNPCTEATVCNDVGVCEGIPVDCAILGSTCSTGRCDPILGCVTDLGEDGTACPGDDACTAGAICDGGVCVVEAVRTCDDQDPCTIDSCDAVLGCTHVGPVAPVCETAGACAGGVPVVCEAGAYRCAYEQMPEYSAVELCDGVDNDCDGTDDDDCVTADVCASAIVVRAFGTDVQACRVAGGLTAGEANCGDGWVRCGYDRYIDALAGQLPPPNDFLLAAVLDYAPDADRWTIVDETEARCTSLTGSCSGARRVQAVTSPTVFQDTIAYARAAWRCVAGEPNGSCESARFAGVMCCKALCLADSDCDDNDPCTDDHCDPAAGACVNTARPVPTCPSTGVCGEGVPADCSALGDPVCGFESVDEWEAAEVSCDGLDNDCDGRVDSADSTFVAAATPPLCVLQSGVCAGAAGTPERCTQGAWADCTAADYTLHSSRYEGAAERSCDGADNDCDGSIDEGFIYLLAEVDEACDGVGACGAGIVECAPSGQGATCSTNPEGSASEVGVEVCNGLDDDCDGETDESLDTAAAGCVAVGVCATVTAARCDGAAGWRCDYTGAPLYETNVETHCDGRDNDCDGETDEDFVFEDLVDGQAKAKGDACGASDCAGEVVVCNAAQTHLECGSSEVCDGKDNDCNGETDDGLTFVDPNTSVPRAVGESCTDRGVCSAGVVECGPQALAVCSTGPAGSVSMAVAERCDALDNDCDGETDEALSWDGVMLGEPCDGVGVCGMGTVVCATSKVATCSTNSDGPDAGAVAETCNGLDDDCDGETDEGLTLADSGCLQNGVCTADNVGASCLGADGWACDYDGVDGYQSGDEVGRCDGFDNDCDGEVDEDFPTLTQPCDGDDADGCATGTIACAIDPTKTICVGETLQEEECGGEDADCDGETDEENAIGCAALWLDADGDGFGVGDSRCLCGPEGLWKAPAAGDCRPDAVDIHPDAPEMCDAIDNDCDGLTDAADLSDLLLFDPRTCENGDGVCAGTTKSATLCVAGGWQPCGPVHYAAAVPDVYQFGVETRCDGLDNDCDGAADAADMDLGNARPLCETQVGVCSGARTPVSRCQGTSGWGACISNDYVAHSDGYEAGEEVSCDGFDNDCDGRADEPFQLDGAAVGGGCDGTGACGVGVVECRGDLAGVVCSTDPGGSDDASVDEVCNNTDDDCNGATDEGLGVADSTCRLVGLCNVQNVGASCQAGVWFCDYDGVEGYEMGMETQCDAQDNDCDGQTDEEIAYDDPVAGLRTEGQTCGAGSCSGGVVVCQADQQGATCSTLQDAGSEACDGIDNDCDGQTDEAITYATEGGGTLALGALCDGYGRCGLGIVACAPDTHGALCSTEPGGTQDSAEPELCNGVDDDCDGLTDDGFTALGVPLGQACDSTGACMVTCTSEGGAACTGGSGPEVCDGLDNDCDGQTDNGLDVYDSDCRLEGVCSPTLVVATCVGAGGWQCDYAHVPHYQANDEVGRCDDLDNDCDGLTDEDYPDIGQSCDGADADDCALGALVCAGDGATLKCRDELPRVEICGGGDEDCDGLTDEPGADDCVVYNLDADRDGYGADADSQCTCAPSGLYDAVERGDCRDDLPAVSPVAKETFEVCDDGLDNDCDGATDQADDGCTCSAGDCRSCGSGECCEQSCNGDCGTCDNGCTCDWSCGANGCDGECLGDSTCIVDFVDTEVHSDITCRGNSTCVLTAGSSSETHLKCHDDTICELDCVDTDRCHLKECYGNAQCLLRCVNSTDCEFTSCRERGGAAINCPGNVQVCNRACP